MEILDCLVINSVQSLLAGYSLHCSLEIAAMSEQNHTHVLTALQICLAQTVQ